MGSCAEWCAETHTVTREEQVGGAGGDGGALTVCVEGGGGRGQVKNSPANRVISKRQQGGPSPSSLSERQRQVVGSFSGLEVLVLSWLLYPRGLKTWGLATLPQGSKDMGPDCLALASPHPAPACPSLTPPCPSLTPPCPSLASPRPSLASPHPTLATPRPTLATPRPTLASPRPILASPRPTLASPRPALPVPADPAPPLPTMLTPAGRPGFPER